MLKRSALFLLLLVGCSSTSPLLTPTTIGKNVPMREAIHVVVKPIATQGIGSEDEKRLGIDLSSYFTAFEVSIVNGTKETISFSPLNVYVQLESGQKLHVLDEEHSIRYYREGDDPSRIALFPKSKKKVQGEIEKIKKSRLIGSDIAPGRQNNGLVLFKKVSHKRCREVILTLEKITVVRTGEKKSFSFPFSCNPKD